MRAQFQQAIEQHRQRIYSFARYSLRVPQDAEDVTQEVFIKLWQHWRRIDHDRLGAWLMRVAHNAVIDHVRRSQTVQKRVDDYAEVDDQGEDEDPGRERDREAFKAQLMQAITHLDDPFRSIVIMRDIQGLSYAEIEKTLEMSESQVKVYLHRARRRLRENPRLRELFDAWAQPAEGGDEDGFKVKGEDAGTVTPFGRRQ